MNFFYLILGSLLLVFTIVDLLWTILWVDGGAGPFSAHVTTWLWKGMRKLGGKHSRVLSLAGPIMLIATLLAWVFLIWAGWTFLFAGGDDALIDTRNNGPVTWVGRIYFVAFTMFTMGNGEFIPKDGFWQIATSFTTASGMLFVTLAVSYVISVFGAVNLKRSFAGTVTGLGDRSETFVKRGWNGKDLRTLDLTLSTLASQLGTLAAQHKAYPILHYYHSEQDKQASALAVAILDEALTLIRYGVPEDYRPNPVLIENARSSVAYYLQTLNSAFIQPADNAPPQPELEPLQDAGIPTVSKEEFASALNNLIERRQKLLGLIEADAWYWPPIKT